MLGISPSKYKVLLVNSPQDAGLNLNVEISEYSIDSVESIQSTFDELLITN